MQEINIREGTITFWTKPNSIDFNNLRTHIFFIYKFIDGELSLFKNENGDIVFTHKYNGNVSKIKKDVKKLSKTKRHFIGVTWSISKKEINLYIDGELKGKEKIIF